jgi:hypothetical protein
MRSAARCGERSRYFIIHSIRTPTTILGMKLVRSTYLTTKDRVRMSDRIVSALRELGETTQSARQDDLVASSQRVQLDSGELLKSEIAQ